MTMALRTTTVSQLIDALQRVADEHDPDMPVMIATQPNYPITHLIDSVNVAEVGQLRGDDEMTAAWIGVSQPGSWVALNPYAPKAAFDDEYL